MKNDVAAISCRVIRPNLYFALVILERLSKITHHSA
jgi:hypothetical protein